MNQPWLTTSDWPVNALLSKPAKNTAVSATSSTVVNSPSTVSFSMTFLMTSASEMPSSVACLALLEADRSGEHVGSALGLLELVHPPIRDLTGLTGILRAGSVGSVDERNALHLVAIVLRIRPSDADGECRPLVIEGK